MEVPREIVTKMINKIKNFWKEFIGEPSKEEMQEDLEHIKYSKCSD